MRRRKRAHLALPADEQVQYLTTWSTFVAAYDEGITPDIGYLTALLRSNKAIPEEAKPIIADLIDDLAGSRNGRGRPKKSPAQKRIDEISSAIAYVVQFEEAKLRLGSESAAYEDIRKKRSNDEVKTVRREHRKAKNLLAKIAAQTKYTDGG